MKGKKGDIPITILVVATIAICIIALVSFHFARKEISNEISIFKHLRILYMFENDIDFSPQKDINFVKEELYPQHQSDKSYYPIVKDVQIAGNYLILKKEVKEGGFLGIGAQEKLVYEFKVPI